MEASVCVDGLTPHWVPSGSTINCHSDYCLIIITHVLSEVVKRLLGKNLITFAENNNIVYFQLGFWKSLGACDPHMAITVFINKVLDSW